MDIYITDGTDDISILDPAIQDFDFKADSGYLEVPAGSYRVLITVADTKTVAIDSGTVDLTAGQVRTAFALDPAPGSSDFGALLLARSELNPSPSIAPGPSPGGFYFFHYGPDIE